MKKNSCAIDNGVDDDDGNDDDGDGDDDDDVDMMIFDDTKI